MINLQKGQRIEVELAKVCVGLGWDPNTTGGEDFDLDASAFMLADNHKLPADEFFCFLQQSGFSRRVGKVIWR